MPIHGQSEFTSRIPTDKSYQLEYLQRSKFTVVRKTGEKPTETTEIRIFRYLNGEWSIWNSDSGGIVVGKKANLRLRHEITPPVEQHNEKAWKASFRLVQEPVNAGKGEKRLPEDQAYQPEYIKTSNLTLKRKAGGNVWRADSNGAALENSGTLVLRPGSAPAKSREVTFDVVQEVENTGREGDRLALWFFLGKEKEWEMYHRFQKDGVRIKQDDVYVKREGK
ncbi:hypothetical protein BDR22DRAFT_887581 [Usnea florida]